MRLYLLRHGERGHGEEQDSLTKLGLKQAEKTAKYFKNIKIDKIISGTSQRAIKTTEKILRECKCKVEYTSLVNEQGLGILQGKAKSEWREAVGKSGLNEKEFRPIGGENEYDAYERAKEFFRRLKSEKSENILVVSHSGFISNIISLLLKKRFEENVNFKTDFSALSYFELDKNFNVLDYRFNEVNHLKYKKLFFPGEVFYIVKKKHL